MNLLKKRIEKFNLLISNFDFEIINQLICRSKIESKLFNLLQYHSKNYVLESKKKSLTNLTPNGFLVPKKELNYTFNQICNIFKEIIFNLNIEKKLSRFSLPTIRLKKNIINFKETRSEIAHADVWVGWPESSFLVILPIDGDLKNNTITFFDNPSYMPQEWLEKTNFIEAQKWVKGIKKIDHILEFGYIYILDISVVHQTIINKNAKERVSIDIPFILNDNLNKNFFGNNSTISIEDSRMLGINKIIDINEKFDQISNDERFFTYQILTI
jgi:hypothetical protein